MTPRRLLFVLCLAVFVFSLPAGAQTCPAPPAAMFPPAPAAFTHTAVVDGDWNAAATWGGSVPGNNAIVCIPLGRKVTVKTQEAARLRYVQANGELRMWIHSSTRLYVDTVFIASGGLFVIGDSVNTVKPNAVAELVFISWDGNPINRTWDPQELSRGFISMGQVRMFGEAKTHMMTMTIDALKNVTSLTLDTAPTNWKMGDQIVLPGSYFRRVSTAASSQDEPRAIGTITGAAITFSPALLYDHIRPRSDLRFHVANLTRNVVFRSEETGTTAAAIARRGHVMLMNGDVDIRHAAFINLGRTDKRVPLDDMVVTLYTDPPNTTPNDYSIVPKATNLVTNRRGRYALHFHLNGTVPGGAPPSKVHGSVVNGTVGWGFVSHSSHVDFLNNVAYDFAGAGFVTEFGDELGNFTNNVAIRGTGNGEYRPVRLVFENPNRPQPLSDFAFSGDGFWFQGPAIRAKNNVAAGCDGAGMMWFTTGAPDVLQTFDAGGGRFHNRYSSFPRGAVPTVYVGFSDLAAHKPRHWDHSVIDEKLVISDLPILECDGFEGYGNLVGFRLRFNNHNNVDWYTDNPFDYEDHIEPSMPGGNIRQPTLMRETVKNIKLWNNEQGFSMRYVTKVDWQNVANVNRLDYNATSAYDGAEINFQIVGARFSGLTADGYEVGALIENCDHSTRDPTLVQFLTTPTYLNYATKDTRKGSVCGVSCANPVVASVVVTGATSRQINLTANSNHGRYLVRFRVTGDQQWRYATSTTTAVSLTGLLTGKTYTYQVIAGCKDGAGIETAPSSYTAAATFGT